MARRSFDEIAADAIARERIGVLRHAAEHAARVDAAQAKGTIAPETAALTKDHIFAAANEIATGLHLDGQDSALTRRAVRDALALRIAEGCLGMKAPVGTDPTRALDDMNLLPMPDPGAPRMGDGFRRGADAAAEFFFACIEGARQPS